MHFLLTFALVFWPWMQEVTGHYNKGPSGGSPTWAFLQKANNSACTAGTSTCNVTVGNTTANSVMACAFSTVDSTQKTLSSCSMSAGGSSWTNCGSGCQVGVTGLWSDVAYSALGGTAQTAPTLTCTLNTASVSTWLCAFFEAHCTANCGTIAIDQVGTAGTSTSCSSCTGASYSGLTGTSDLMVQFANVANTGSCGGGCGIYTLTSDTVWLYALNTTSTTAPTLTQTGAGKASIPGLSFK
jgi:hypothetical protein